MGTNRFHPPNEAIDNQSGGDVPIRRAVVIRRIFHVADRQVYRQSHAGRTDADSMGTIQAVAG